jgi:hypothetical protein
MVRKPGIEALCSAASRLRGSAASVIGGNDQKKARRLTGAPDFSLQA